VHARIAAVLVGLVVLVPACDAGPDSSESEKRKREPDRTPWYESPQIIEACRDLYEGPPEGEEAFVDKCVEAVSGLPDPGLNELS
jgi:hypothetical protein